MLKIILYSTLTIVMLTSNPVVSGIGGWLVGGYEGNKEQEDLAAARKNGWVINDSFDQGDSIEKRSNDNNSSITIGCTANNFLTLNIRTDDNIGAPSQLLLKYPNSVSYSASLKPASTGGFNVIQEKDTVTILNMNRHQKSVQIILIDDTGAPLSTQTFDLSHFDEAMTLDCERAVDIRHDRLIKKIPPVDPFEGEDE